MQNVICNKLKKIKIVIPLYRNFLTNMETISLVQCKSILSNYPICIIKPSQLILKMDEIEGIETIDLDDKWFQSVQTYNALMLSEQFYEKFVNYEYILVHQLDAFIFKDELSEFCKMNYDYIGAPWLYGQFVYKDGEGGYYYVGNGGLSLRKVKAHLDVLRKRKTDINYNEDSFFSAMQSESFRVAPISISLKFAFETNVRKCFEKNQNKMPFGCHAWHKYDFAFFRPYFQELGYDTENIIDEKLDKREYDSKCNLSQIPENDFRSTVDSMLSRKVSEIWIWGCGKIGKECGWLLQKNNIEIKGYLDQNIHIQGETVYGRYIQPIDNYWKDNENTALIVAMNPVPSEIREQLCQKNKMEGRDYICWNMLKSELGVNRR